ncbi:MAG TPA: RNA-binding protein [Elusimicrobia bacterium]|nr:RNA-binding protein [Elusimicrobiota bacterium]
MKKLAHFLIKNLADHSDQVSVQDSEQGDSVTLKLIVAEDDKGKIIGKKGKVIRAIRALVSSAASKTGKKIVVDID